jgi:RNA polymerase sigma-70 factor (ECF subfamily)
MIEPTTMTPRPMSTAPTGASTREAMLAAMHSDDAGGFAELVEPYRRELHVHCYRMLASFEDAQDLVQETLLKAWRRRETFEGRASVRAWLYRIATNACLDFLDRRPERSTIPLPDEDSTTAEILWLQPFPDRLLTATDAEEPGAAAVTRETIELAFLVAVQHLPARQRAVLILRDVLGWTAKESASLLDMTVPAANSALQRARETMRTRLPDHRLDWTFPDSTDDEHRLVQRYIDAADRMDPDGLAELLHHEVRFAMPPEPGTWVGRETVVQSWVEGGFGDPAVFDDFRCVATRANMQPAVANYMRKPGESVYRGLAVDVLRIRDGLVIDITMFDGSTFPWFGLPEVLEPS